MLQRAASNAYSWWWASHIRTNQSKWLDNNLQDMDERVQSMLKIIEEDADSFAKRAEMYYKRRPELINFVEETYRAYRALAERYDRISGELHKANHTLATAFPDVEFPMQDEDEDGFPKALSSTDSVDRTPPEFPQISLHKPPPEVPKISLISKNNGNKPAPQKSPPRAAPKKSKPRNFTSQISEDEAKEEIDRLQKGILILQTEKEFIKSSYESGIAKSWAIEKKITEMQEEVCFLEDEFSASSVIEDDEARALMAVTALKSCKDTLVNLQEQQKRSTEETRIESERINDAKEKLKALKSECGQAEEEMEDVPDENTGTGPPIRTPENESCDLEQESLDIQLICEKVKEHFETNTSGVDLAEKIDQLVNKVINLELIVASQGAQIEHLRSEIDELQRLLRRLEEEKVSLIDDSNNLSDRLKQAGEELHKVQNLEKLLNSEKSVLRRVFAEACHSLSEISEKLQSPKHPVQDQTAEESQYPEHTDHGQTVEQLQFPKLLDQVDTAGPFSSHEEDRSLHDTELEKASDVNGAMTAKDTKDKAEGEDHKNEIQSESNPLIGEGLRKSEPEKHEDEIREKENDNNHVNTDPDDRIDEQEDAPNLQELLLNGLEGRENILLTEYTSILRTYKETKRKLFEVEKKNEEYFSETMSQVKELKSANDIKDEEIQLLRQILSSLQMQNSAILEDVNVKGTAKKDTSSGVRDGGGPHTEEDIKLYLASVSQTISPIEEKFRKDIDTLLDENLEFWLRFSTSFHQIQRFRTDFQNLQSEIDKDGNMKEGSSSSSEQGKKPECTPLFKQLRELKTELQVWLEQNALLRAELQSRFSSLCNIQEEISGAAGGVQFTPYQAAKFQGEVLNMQQENNKVAVELKAGLDHVKALQTEVEKSMSKLHEKFELSASKSNHHNSFRNFSSKSKGVPLRSFLYGVKPKKPSIFSCMSPALQKQYSDLRAGMPL